MVFKSIDLCLLETPKFSPSCPFFKKINLSLKTFLNSFYYATYYLLNNFLEKLNQGLKHFVGTKSTCPNIYMPYDKFLMI